MLGNLQIFMGQDQLNSYAEFLHSMGPLLWVVRAFLFLFFFYHVYKGIQLKLENTASRPSRYAYNDTVQATLASRTMIWTGLIVLSFLTYHLLHLTVRVTDPSYQNLLDPIGRPDVYQMVILGFSNIWVSLFYIIAVGLLCFHLTHGIQSMFQSVGLNQPDIQQRLARWGTAFSVLLFLGYISIPLAVWFNCPLLESGRM
jgi:succinate dehydrogenase / fumarate reductase cytochrome b subunit